MAGEVSVDLHSEPDILQARQCARALAKEEGFCEVELTLIATAVSELARNIVQYAGAGRMTFKPRMDGRHGITVIADDDGPGVGDVGLAMQDGYSTGGGLGIGLPGTRRLMDEFHISSSGAGTCVTVTKWTR